MDNHKYTGWSQQHPHMTGSDIRAETACCFPTVTLHWTWTLHKQHFQCTSARTANIHKSNMITNKLDCVCIFNQPLCPKSNGKDSWMVMVFQFESLSGANEPSVACHTPHSHFLSRHHILSLDIMFQWSLKAVVV